MNCANIMQKARIYEDLIAEWAGTRTETPETAAVAGGAEDDSRPPPRDKQDRGHTAESRD